MRMHKLVTVNLARRNMYVGMLPFVPILTIVAVTNLIYLVEDYLLFLYGCGNVIFVAYKLLRFRNRNTSKKSNKVMTNDETLSAGSSLQ